MGLRKYSKYDAYVLYRGDTPLGVYGSIKEIARVYGVDLSVARSWLSHRVQMDERYANRTREGCQFMLVEPVKFDEEDWHEGLL